MDQTGQRLEGFSNHVVTADGGGHLRLTQQQAPMCSWLTVPSASLNFGFVCGMPDVQIGDILGDAGPVPGSYELNEPLLSVRAIPADEADHAKLAQALQQLSSEDPHLNFTWFDEERELHVKIMGTIQTEILTEVLETRFGIPARFDEPTVLYKETPASTGYGIERYTMPKPCWAIVKYLVEPGERGSGVDYSSTVSVNDIKAKYQSEIAGSIQDALKQGIKGWEVTDLKITLVEGSDHVLHSRSGNFKLATNIAVLKGLTETGTILLEPILSYRIEAPESFIGKITAEIANCRGTVEPAQTEGGQVVVSGRIPLATSMDFPIRLNEFDDRWNRQIRLPLCRLRTLSARRRDRARVQGNLAAGSIEVYLEDARSDHRSGVTECPSVSIERPPPTRDRVGWSRSPRVPDSSWFPPGRTGLWPGRVREQFLR